MQGQLLPQIGTGMLMGMTWLGASSLLQAVALESSCHSYYKLYMNGSRTTDFDVAVFELISIWRQQELSSLSFQCLHGGH